MLKSKMANKEFELLYRGAKARGTPRRATREARELPPFHSPRAGKQTRIAGRGKHKAKKY